VDEGRGTGLEISRNRRSKRARSRRRRETLYRRIGRNELDTIKTSLAFVDAEDEYADKDRGDGVGVYVHRIGLRVLR
jgi:hypothetical protein